MEYSEELKKNFEDMQELEKKLESFDYSRSYCFGSSIPGKMTGCVYTNTRTGVNVETIGIEPSSLNTLLKTLFVF